MFGHSIPTLIKMTKITKSYLFLIWFYASIMLFAIAGTIIYFTFFYNDSKGYQVRTIQTINGFGYEISTNNKVLIHQEYIPAVPGNKSFKSVNDALEVGDMVAVKLQNGLSPTITLQEIIDKKIQIE